MSFVAGLVVGVVIGIVGGALFTRRNLSKVEAAVTAAQAKVTELEAKLKAKV